MQVYNLYDTINRIANYKKNYEDSVANGDIEGAKKAAETAKPFYNALRSAGATSYADKLSESNYEQATKIAKQAGKYGNTPFREYMYNKGQSRGLDKKKIDSMIKFDNDTGQIYFGGKNIGNPTAIVDGVSYYSDTSVLDKAFDEYVKRSGKTLTNDYIYGENMKNAAEANKKLVDKLFANEKERNDYIYSNPYETSEADNIRGFYGLKGSDAANNALADGAGANGGNIDSFAQADYNRWKAYYNNLAAQNILNQYNARIDGSIRSDNEFRNGILSATAQQSQNAQQAFENERTKQNDAFDRLLRQAEVTGYVPEDLDNANNYFLNSDGTITDENIDYQAIINNAQSQLKNGNADAETAQSLRNTIRYAQAARAKKILGNLEKYGKYSDTVVLPGRELTASERQAVHDRSEDTENNKINRYAIESSITGKTPETLTLRKNPYVNENGNVANIDYKTRIDEIDKLLSSGKLSATDKEAYQKERKYLYDARVKKIYDDYANLSKYAGDVIDTWSAPQSEPAREFDEQTASAERIANTGYASEVSKSAIAADTAKYQSDVAASTADKDREAEERMLDKQKEAADAAAENIKNGTYTQDDIKTYNDYYKTKYTMDNPPQLDGALLDSEGNSNGEEKKTMYVPEKIDDSRLKDCGVDEHGKKMIEKLNERAVASGGMLSEDEVLEFVINNSNSYNTNLNQLRKVYDYLELDKSKLDKFEDAGFWFWEWGKGVKRSKDDEKDSNK
ncbi:MAG: hypothetical protein J6N52_05605 [Clostridia bacterium]|nr:hypothetical protein [Clostridia bacterium]